MEGFNGFGFELLRYSPWSLRYAIIWKSENLSLKEKGTM
jgi:hypothetical protein